MKLEQGLDSMKNEMNSSESSPHVSFAEGHDELVRTRKQVRNLLVALILTVLAGIVAGTIGLRSDGLRMQAEQKVQESQQRQQEAYRRSELAGQREQAAQRNAELAGQKEQEAYQNARQALQKQQEAQQNADLAGQKEKEVQHKLAGIQIDLLAAQSQAALNESPELSLLLANEAVRMGNQAAIYNPVGQTALRNVMAKVKGVLSFKRSTSNLLLVSPDGRWLASIAGDRVWLSDLQAKNPAANIMELYGHDLAIYSLTFSPDGRWLVSGGDQTVRIWDLHAKNPGVNPLVLRGHEDWISSLSISADGRWLVSADYAGMIQRWDLQSENPNAAPLVLRGHKKVDTVVISPNGRWLASGSRNTLIRLWDLQTAGRQWDLMPKIPTVDPYQPDNAKQKMKLIISPDGHWLAASGEDTPIWLWDLQAQDPKDALRILGDPELNFTALTISPDGRWLVSAGMDGRVRLWDLQAKDPAARSVVLAQYGLGELAMSVDGRWLAVIGYNKTIWLWDLQAKDLSVPSSVLPGYESGTAALAISLDGRWLIAGDYNGVVRLWELSIESLLEQSCQRAGRNLTHAEWFQYFPPGEPYHITCPAFPEGEK